MNHIARADASLRELVMILVLGALFVLVVIFECKEKRAGPHEPRAPIPVRPRRRRRRT